MNRTDSITYREIKNLEDIHEVVLLQSDIWSDEVVSPLPQLVASIHHGGIIIGAYVEDRLVGFCFGFAGFKNGESYLVSHMAGVRPEYQNCGVGFQLKIKQREWAIAYGYQKIVWTYDPLEVRNGFFNLCKLGAYSRTYLSSYYGEMEDKLNKGLPSDRLLIEWDICSIRVEKALHGELPYQSDYEILLQPDGEYPSQVEKKFNTKQKGYLVSVPTDIQRLKQTNFDAAKFWRFALRSLLNDALLKGYVITGVKKNTDSMIHYYILENKRLEEIHE
ncbi:GNAT family N-acetyltransferase [Neobacillus terrae]|uniref:GNAT family N-acetyltransferase n=1 Tax=Neobacillus terrae TaxID=3034837 RepID=UPI00140BA502|nr:GNAT family N-acetyltransferase [Neobacillus terrae]NHM31300.1 GNAT family N-acetyltransferase [Neobacillus terrae]